MNQKQYYKDLKKRQKEHLDSIRKLDHIDHPWSPCAHDSCPECIGTGKKKDGSRCIHMIYCGCPRCSNIQMGHKVYVWETRNAYKCW